MDFTRLNQNMPNIRVFYDSHKKLFKGLENAGDKFFFPIDQCASYLRDCFRLIDDLIKLDLKNVFHQETIDYKTDEISHTLFLARNAFNVCKNNQETWPSRSRKQRDNVKNCLSQIDGILTNFKEFFDAEIVNCMESEDQETFRETWRVYNQLAKQPNSARPRLGTYDYKAHIWIYKGSEAISYDTAQIATNQDLALGKIFQNILDVLSSQVLQQEHQNKLYERAYIVIPINDDKSIPRFDGDKNICELIKNLSYRDGKILNYTLSKIANLYFKNHWQQKELPQDAQNIELAVEITPKLSPIYT